MRVSFNGKTHKVPVKPGEEGQAEFAAAIRKLLSLPEEQEFDVSDVYVFCVRHQTSDSTDPSLSRYCLLLLSRRSSSTAGRQAQVTMLGRLCLVFVVSSCSARLHRVGPLSLW
jgi:hypothetical protein